MSYLNFSETSYLSRTIAPFFGHDKGFNTMQEMLITMSHKELDRQSVMKGIQEKRYTQVKAAEMLNMSLRQVQRLYARYRKEGPKGLVSRKRGKSPNNVISDDVKHHVLSIIREKYADFGPTFAAEKLLEEHLFGFAVETIRRWMIDSEIWLPRAKRLKRAYQPRYRRECSGELIQIDGSLHHWFEDRGPKCTLLVYIDDATGQLMECQFAKAESTFTYFNSTRRYLEKHGKPVAFYSDKHSTFRTNKKGELGGAGVTQFGRALTELNIDIICANSPQAKGRVERANRTLQDRLVKEMRLRRISTIETANEYLPEFIATFNDKFRKEPVNSKDLHRPLLEHEDLNEIFCWQEQRTLSNSLTVQYDKVIYLIKDSVETRKLARKKVTVFDYYDGTIKIKHDGKSLPYSIFEKMKKVTQSAVVDNKRLGAVLSLVKERQDSNSEIDQSSHSPSRRHLDKPSTLKIRQNTRVKRAREAIS